jgi:hypothetical protein
VIQHDAVLLAQVLGRQSRPESLFLRTGIFFSNQMQNSAAQFQPLAAIREPAGIPMLAPLAAYLPIPSPQSFRRAIAELEDRSGWRSQSKGTFLNSSGGDIIIKFQ